MISELRDRVCCSCGKNGFTGREEVEETLATDGRYLHQNTYWIVKCIYCGSIERMHYGQCSYRCD
jgi:hypothetical protein